MQNYLQILEITLVVVALRPFSGASPVELRAQPKVYAFDNGFVGYLKDIASLRPDDRGPMLEHLVLNELLAHFGRDEVYYWRDKQKHEVDFVVKAGRGRAPLAIECKVASTRFDPSGLAAFRRRHPSGPNLVACLDLAEPLSSRVGGLDVRFVPFDRFDKELGPWIRS